jgi:recombination protein RecA
VEKALEKSGAFLPLKCQVNDGKNLTFHLQKTAEITIFKQLKINKLAVKKVVVKEADSKCLAAIESLNKKYGVGSILALDSKAGGDYDVISTGSIGFDHITLGVGGFVKGKLYELMGWEGTGKSTICGHAAAECQKAGGTVLYIDGEHAVDKNYFKKLGVDTTKMLIAQPSCGEEGFNIAMEMINTGEIDLVIIDSDSSLIPKKVLDGEGGDSSIGLKAR